MLGGSRGGVTGQPGRRGRPCPAGRTSVVALGSSVAAGSAAPAGQGWTDRLAAMLRPRGFKLQNFSMGDTTVEAWLRLLDELDLLTPALAGAGVVLVSLSLANEGLPDVCDCEEMLQIESAFTTGLREIARRIRACCEARLVFCGPYPDDEYDVSHLEVLQRIFAAMRAWEEVDFVVEFLVDTVHDGAGRWKRGLSADPSHPNGCGHEAMFMCVDVEGLLGL